MGEKSAFFFFFEVGKGQLSKGGRKEVVHLQCRDRAVLGKSTCDSLNLPMCLYLYLNLHGLQIGRLQFEQEMMVTYIEDAHDLRSSTDQFLHNLLDLKVDVVMRVF